MKRDEPGRVGGADTGAAVTDGAVGDGELSEVVSDHLGHDAHKVEYLAVVHSDVGVDHLGDDQHISKVGLDGHGLVKRSAGYKNGF
jgi:hypothetical protein